MKRTELVVLFVIMAIAVGFRLYGLQSTPPGLYPDEAMVGNEAIQAWRTGHFQVFYPYNNGEEGLYANLAAIPVHFFGNTAWALRLTSAIAGILTVLGTYLLARQLFDNWELAAMAAFLMATGFWHVNFSRIAFRAILSPLMTVWSLYYLVKGMRSHRLWHWGLAGLFLGLGMYTYIAFRVIPVVVVLVILTYWWAMRNEFSHDKFSYSRGQFWGSAAFLVAVSLLVVTPLAAYFATHRGDLLTRAAQVSVFSGPHPWSQFATNFTRMLGMFVFRGDGNWRHNLAGQAVLFWPVAALFAVGFIRSFLKIGRTLRTHGHPSTTQILLVSWLFIGLVPAALSNEGIPHALRGLIVAPAVYIIAGEGLWWLFTWLRHWYDQRDVHQICLPGPRGHQYCAGEGTVVVTFTLFVFLLAIAIGDGSRYFFDWARNPITASAFNQNYVDIAKRLNALPPATLKYVVVRDSGITATGFAISAQTVMYLTDTWMPAQQKEKNIYYLHQEQFNRHQYPKGAIVIQQDP